MNSLLRIRVQVIAREAQKLASIAASLTKISTAATKASTALAALSRVGSGANLVNMEAALNGLAGGLAKISAVGRGAAASLNALTRLQKSGSMSGGKSGLVSSLTGSTDLSRQVKALAPAFAAISASGVGARQVLSALNSTIRMSDADFTELRIQLQALGVELQQFGLRAAAATAPLTALTGAMKANQAAVKGGAATTAATNSMNAYGAAAQKAKFSLGELFKAHGWGHRTFTQWSKDLQWIGRQIEFNFTLPIALAIGLATKWAMEAEKGFTRLKKVYGDVSTGAQEFARDEANLRKVTVALSDIFGVQQGEVSALAAEWAAAGMVGADLARAMRNTLEAVIVGDFDSTHDAFEALVQVQTAYNLSSQELRRELAILNAIENETAANFQDLTIGVAKAGGAARTAGVDVRHLAAMMSVLTPATGSAETAGNGLRSIMSRLMAPTEDAKEAMRLMGVQFESTAFQAKNGVGRLEELAKAFDGLTNAQKAIVSSYIATRWQVNRFDVLMRAIIDQNSAYNRALRTTADNLGDNSAVMQAYVREIGTFLTSSPQAFKILSVQLQNTLIQAVTPFIPAILGILARIRDLARAFSELDPGIQQLIVVGVVALAALGPILRLAGAFGLVFGMAGKLAKALGLLWAAFLKIGAGVVGAVGWPVLAIVGIIAGVITAITVFRNQIDAALANVANSFGGLPRAIANALRAVVQTVANAAMAVYEWLSWMNPFARHSPSLVEQVDRGVDYITKRYRSLSGLSSAFRRAADDYRAFLAATEGGKARADAADRAEQRTQILSANPGAGPATDALYGSLDRLKASLPGIADEISRQSAVVDRAEAEWDAIRKQVDAAKAAYDDFVQPYDDQLRDLALREKEVRLELMNLEDAGQGFKDLQDMIAGINGDIDQLRGKADDLRRNGAGSDVTGPIMDQIAALEAQRRTLEGQADQAADLQDELERLSRMQQRLELERDIAADPYLRQIEALERLEKTARATYDAEKDELDKLNDAYKAVEDQIRDIESALSDMAQAADKVAKGSKGGAGGGGGGAGGGLGGSFGAAGAGDFETPGGSGFKAGTEDLASLAEQWTKEAGQMFKGFDIFKPFKDAWATFMGILPGWMSNLKVRFAGAGGFGGLFDAISKTVQQGFDKIKKWYSDFLNNPVVRGIVDRFTDLKNTAAPIFGAFVDFVVRVGQSLVDHLRGWGDLFEPFKRALGTLGAVAGVAMMVLLDIMRAGWAAIEPIVKPVLDWLLAIVDFAMTTIHSIIKLVLSVIGGDWESAWDAIKEFLGGWWDFIKAMITSALAIIRGILVGAWEGIKSITSSAWDGIKNIIVTAATWFRDRTRDAINELVRFFQALPGNIISGLGDLGGKIWTAISGGLTTLVENAKTKVQGMIDWFKSLPSKITEAIKGAWNAAANWLNQNVISKVQFDLPFVGKVGLPYLPTFAKGGIMPGDFSDFMLAGLHGSEMVLNPMQQARLFALANGKMATTERQSDGTTIVINGDLSFPNITDGDDAETFIKNLEAMVPKR